MTEKTHYRKAFDSPYLSAADIVGPTTLTIARVALEKDKTKKTQDLFNTAFFVESEIRRGEKLKPMILNSTNSKTLKQLTGSAFIEDWAGQAITVYVDPHVRFGKETVEGLRISPFAPEANVTFVAQEAIKEVNAAKTKEDLQEVWQRQGADAVAAKDRAGHAQLKAAVIARKAELAKAEEQAKEGGNQ